MNLQDTVIVSTCRTPLGKIRGGLSSCRPDDLLALVFKEAILRAKLDPALIDEAFAGAANQSGEDNRNVARMAVLLANLPEQIPAMTVNRLCASGLEALIQAHRSIAVGDASATLVGGVESMSRAPWVMGKPEQAFPTGAPAVFDTSLGWRFPNPQLEKRFPLETMGQTAENVALRYEISREAQDAFAFQSHQKAVLAQQKGYFEKEIMPVQAGRHVVEHDEGPRADTSLEKLSTLKPVFQKDGTVTAGNSSTLNDGAAAMVACSRAFASAHGLRVMARVRAVASAGVDPRVMGIGPVPATQKVLAKAGLQVSDLDAVELNEAFAAQAVAVIQTLGLDPKKVNQFGGAIALGHPLGCSGARLVVTLLNVLEQTGGTLGLVTLCVGVGQGLSVILERE